MNQIIDIFTKMVQLPDLASKKWVTSQYDHSVRNNTIDINSDAAIIRVEGSKNKALAISSDCTPRYVKADPYLGAMQAVCETYRNISASGAKPLAITNCLNFGNPEKPEIMGQIVRAIKGINEACKFLNYPVISGNVSLYNETNSAAINPTPTIAAVGLFKDLTKRANIKFKNISDDIFLIGNISGHINCSLYERDILGKKNQKNPPPINLELEKKHSIFVRDLISSSQINSSHDISDGGLLIALFEMCNENLTFKIDIKNIKTDLINFYFGEDQACYICTCSSENSDNIINLARDNKIEISKIGEVSSTNISISNKIVNFSTLQKLNQNIFPTKFN